jgi:hypothetical protein
MNKLFIWLGLIVGSTVGGLVPLLWGDDVISVAGIALSAVGGIAGIIAGYKLAQSMG